MPTSRMHNKPTSQCQSVSHEGEQNNIWGLSALFLSYSSIFLKFLSTDCMLFVIAHVFVGTQKDSNILVSKERRTSDQSLNSLLAINQGKFDINAEHFLVVLIGGFNNGFIVTLTAMITNRLQRQGRYRWKC